MKYRIPANPSKDRRIFAKTAMKRDRRNIPRVVMRGGTRL